MTPERLRAVVSAVLLIGVTVSAVLIAVGFAASFAVGWQGSLTGAAPVATSPGDFQAVVRGLVEVRPLAITQLGILCLVATPILRVMTSLVAFALERDRLYVAITAIVLAILLASALFVR